MELVDQELQLMLEAQQDFPSSGTNYFQVGGEEISYTGVTATSFTGITRAVRGSTRAAHSGGATITNTSSWTGWGSAAANTDKVTDPGLWSIDNLGDNVIALIHNSASIRMGFSSRLMLHPQEPLVITGAPTASRDMLVSTPDRHLILFGTETTIGDTIYSR